MKSYTSQPHNATISVGETINYWDSKLNQNIPVLVVEISTCGLLQDETEPDITIQFPDGRTRETTVDRLLKQPSLWYVGISGGRELGPFSTEKMNQFIHNDGVKFDFPIRHITQQKYSQAFRYRKAFPELYHEWKEQKLWNYISKSYTIQDMSPEQCKQKYNTLVGQTPGKRKRHTDNELLRLVYNAHHHKPLRKKLGFGC